jgi:hypothetical protein
VGEAVGKAVVKAVVMVVGAVCDPGAVGGVTKGTVPFVSFAMGVEAVVVGVGAGMGEVVGAGMGEVVAVVVGEVVAAVVVCSSSFAVGPSCAAMTGGCLEKLAS